jgi:hypothetical protein
MSEKHPLLAEEEECFFLTSPFIEPDGLEKKKAASLQARPHWREMYRIVFTPLFF